MDEVGRRLKGSLYMNLGLRYDGKPDYLGNFVLYAILFGVLIPFFILMIYFHAIPYWLIILMIIIIILVSVPLAINLKKSV